MLTPVRSLLRALVVAAAVASPVAALAQDCVAQVDANGNVKLPPGATNVKRIDQRAGKVTGSVSALYRQYNTKTDNWYQQAAADSKCPFSIGTPPPPTKIPDIPTAVQHDTGLTPVQQQAYVASMPDRTHSLVQNVPALTSLVSPFGKIFTGAYVEPLCEINNPPGPPKPMPCSAFLDRNSPFGGRDIIYIHGFMPSTLISEIVRDDPGAQLKWPVDRNAFFGTGWWKKQADGYWSDHLTEYLVPRNAKNRILVVAWPSTQTMEFAAHAVLQQISDAMTTGRDVQTRFMRTGDLRGTRGFCVGGCVIVSHSTGGPVTDVALSLAAKTASTGRGSNPLQTVLGDLSFISTHVAVHVGLAPALSGSGIAAATTLAALNPTDPVICPIGLTAFAILNGRPLPSAISGLPSCTIIAPLVLTSMLRDLTPIVMRTLWHPFISSTTVPVLTVTGATPYDDRMPPTKELLLNGLDDGVVQMDSTCGRMNLDLTWPTGFFFDAAQSHIPNPLLFDPGIAAGRSTGYFADQSQAYRFSATTTPRAAAACNPFKAPWGMIEPVPSMSNPFSAPVQLLPNHFSFLQSAQNHGQLVGGGPANLEEVRAIQDDAVFTRGLVSTAMQTNQDEIVRGEKVSFTLTVAGRTIKYEWWLWKRTYHLLHNWETKKPSDYVYDFVLKP